MTSAATTREPLRSRERSYEGARLACWALISREPLAQATPQLPPKLTYAEAFEHAVEALIVLDWRTFAGQSMERTQYASGFARVRAVQGPVMANTGVTGEVIDGENLWAFTRAWQLSRGPSGLTHLRLGRHKGPGRGESSSGPRFDTVEFGEAWLGGEPFERRGIERSWRRRRTRADVGSASRGQENHGPADQRHIRGTLQRIHP